MWTVVYVAPGLTVAERIKQVLEKEGLMVKLRSISTSKRRRSHVEILVPESEAEEAQAILCASLGY